LDNAVAEHFAADWIEAWNAHDLEHLPSGKRMDTFQH